MLTSRTAELSGIIQQNTKEINQFLFDNGCGELSFDVSPPAILFANTELDRKRLQVIESAKELADLMQSPFHLFTETATSSMVGLNAMCRLGVAEMFADRDSMSFEEIALKARQPISIITRLMRATMTNHIFKECEPGIASHTAASRIICDTRMLPQCLTFLFEELLPASFQIGEALSTWPGSGAPNQSGYNVQFGTEETLYQHMNRFPKRKDRFISTMTLFNQDPGLDHRHLVENYPWTVMGDATVVDMGGSSGGTMLALAKAFPRLRCIVQDLPELESAAADLIKTNNADSVSFMAHNFFTEQPVKGAEIYFVRWILHNWSDEYAGRILRALIPALKDGAKILVQDFVLPELGEVPNYQERLIRTIDLEMLGLQNGKERSISDYKALFAGVDSRFQDVQVTLPPASKLGLIEVTWREKQDA